MDRRNIDFIAIDVETANPDYSSICQIGFAFFEDGKLIENFAYLIDPEDWFADTNILIHGISPEDVEGEMKYPTVHEIMSNDLSGYVFACHTAFDRVAFKQAAGKYNLEPLDNTWLDTARVVRRAWPEFAQSGYGLTNIARYLGIKYSAHDAGEDARAAGLVLLAAIEKTDLDINDWFARIKKPLDLSTTPFASSIKLSGNPEGPLYGETIVFTGTLSMSRREAADLAAAAGCNVIPNVNKNTTILVLGDHDKWKLAGHNRSSKQRKAERWIEKGKPIRIIGETDFKHITELNE